MLTCPSYSDKPAKRKFLDAIRTAISQFKSVVVTDYVTPEPMEFTEEDIEQSRGSLDQVVEWQGAHQSPPYGKPMNGQNPRFGCSFCRSVESLQEIYIKGIHSALRELRQR